MAVFARGPEAGVFFRCLFVVAAMGGVWASWRVAHADGLTLRHVIGLAILCRLLLLPLLPVLSDDGYRYIWDGVVFTQLGASPYAAVPSDIELTTHQLDALFLVLNSPDYYSVYPPFSQAVFALGGLFYESGWQVSWYVIKLGFVVLEGIGIACLSRLVSARGVALYALHPIVLLEIAGQGHTEGALVCALGLAMWSISRWPGWAGFALAMAGWVKLFPLALALLLGGRWRGWAGCGGGFLLGAALLIPENGFSHILESVRLYGGTLDFYSAPFLAFKSILYPIAGESAGRWAAVALSAMWGIVVLGVVLSCNGTARSFKQGLAICVIAYALLSPMQHPWNWLGALFLIPLLQNKTNVYWITSISLMTYLRYVGLESLYGVAILVGWGGGLALTIYAYRRSHESSSVNAASTSSTEAVSASSHT